MRLSLRGRNRTLLARQRLLAREPGTTAGLVHHLVGLQAQETWSPYFAASARLDAFDPQELSQALHSATLVRLSTMRSTIHLLSAEDGLSLRFWTQPVQDRERKASSTIRPAFDVDPCAFREVLSSVLAHGPLRHQDLGAALSLHYPSVPATALVHLARVLAPLAQLPPRGCWREGGGVIYQYVDRWVGRPLLAPDPPSLVRRYLRAFGPASVADLSQWSGMTRLGELVKSMPDLVQHSSDSGKVLFDVADGVLIDPDVPAPVRLLGQYDNVWLSHADRDHIAPDELRRRWMGVNGGVACAIFADGCLAGLWRVRNFRPEVVELFRPFTRGEQTELESELDRVRTLLSM